MKRSVSISARWAVATAAALVASLLVIGSATSSGAGPATSKSGQRAAAYYLIGDATNTGASPTNFNSTSAGEAWHFAASGSSATALVGQCPNGSACWGVQGLGTGIGVYGSVSNPSNIGGSIMGVQGSGGSTGANGTSYGGYFTAANGANGGTTYGAYASGATAGLYATSDHGDGVYAKSTSASGNGVHATGSGSSYYGVWGDVGGNGFGIVGSSSGGTGVYGTTSGSTSAATTAGAYGYNSLSALGASSASNSGVVGLCDNCNGVSGTSANYVGVRGTATGSGAKTYGGYFTSPKGIGALGVSDYYGVYGTSKPGVGVGAASGSSYAIYAATSTGTVTLRAINPNPAANYYAGLFDGNVRINGNYYATGTKTAVVPTAQGDRLMYAEEATQNYFSDQGSAVLKNGRAVVRIDSLFAQTVDLGKPYMVIVTPQSFDTTGLGVGNLTPGSFEVRELNGGKGNFTFSWRITALRKGYANDRMNAAPANVPAAAPSALGAGVLPTKPSPTDTPITDPSVAPPTTKAPTKSSEAPPPAPPTK
jgi:hypothetical protein